jgi:hypothetical protein
MGQVDDVRRSQTSDFKRAGGAVYVVGQTRDAVIGSQFERLGLASGGGVPLVDAAACRAVFRAVAGAIDAGLVAACHDVSDGGLLVAVAEMMIGGGLGASVDLTAIPLEGPVAAFAETQAAKGGEAASLDREIRVTILGDEMLGPVARNLIKLWYVGSWYQMPSDWRETHGGAESDCDFVVSPAAYTEGLLWPAIGANPQGAKPHGYGMWALPPRIKAV